LKQKCPKQDEKTDQKTILSSTNNWILPTQPLGVSNKTLAPLQESKLIALREKAVDIRDGGAKGTMNFPHIP